MLHPRLALFALALAACRAGGAAVATPAAAAPAAEAPWERDNPVRALPAPPLGMEVDLAALQVKVTPEKVRLGRWLFYDGSRRTGRSRAAPAIARRTPSPSPRRTPPAWAALRARASLHQW